jgi:uncharacterized lipoprotein YbaY
LNEVWLNEFEPISPKGLAAGQMKGTATYRERMALPPNAVFEATLEDVSRADAPAEVIARARIEHPSNPPIPFEITYDPSRINPSHRYAVRARILVDGKLYFTTGKHYQVLTAGQSTDVALLLRRGRFRPGRSKCGNIGKSACYLWWQCHCLTGEYLLEADPPGRSADTHRFAATGTLFCP